VGDLTAPAGAADLTPEWLDHALAGVRGDAVVVEVAGKPIGTGQVAESIRLSLTWDRPTDAPATLVAKVPSPSETSRAAAAATGTYLVEAGFYRDLAHTLDVHRPPCYAAVHDPETNGYCVLLGDLAPATQGDQLAGCSVDEAALCVPELVALAAPRWGDPSLSQLEWLAAPGPEQAEGMSGLMGMFLEPFLARYEGRVDPDVGELLQRLVPRLVDYFLARQPPYTVTHGDFRLDNLLFGGERVAVLDWQTVKQGDALSDVAYFIGASLQVEDRRAAERDLVREYHDRLTSRGVDLGWDDCWDRYRRAAPDGLLMALAASQLVQQTDRGDEMFMAMANRHGRQALDLGSEELF
jgi:hypothetical protein